MRKFGAVGVMAIAVIYATIAFFGAMGLGGLAIMIAGMSISISGGCLTLLYAVLFVGSAVIALVAGKGYLDSREQSE